MKKSLDWAPRTMFRTGSPVSIVETVPLARLLNEYEIKQESTAHYELAPAQLRRFSSPTGVTASRQRRDLQARRSTPHAPFQVAIVPLSGIIGGQSPDIFDGVPMRLFEPELEATAVA